MEFFKKYTSNTYASAANQYLFEMPKGVARTSRIFYKISVGGEYEYSFLYSNITDSTFADGSVSHCNIVCDSWEILGARVTVTPQIYSVDELDSMAGFVELTFDGKKHKSVGPGEFFSTDAVKLNANKGDYICLELKFTGETLPYHEETIISAFINDGDGWIACQKTPFACMIGCNRDVKHRVAFLGDSITQGIGTATDSYAHWNAVLSEMLPEENAYWNLGIGYARASDAASDGAWLFKVKQNDVAVVCMGVNDLLQWRTVDQIKNDITTIVTKLKSAGLTVILQTVPPFDYDQTRTAYWNEINEYIKTVLCDKVNAVFDVVPHLGDKDQPQRAIYVGHPNVTGCKVWAEALYPLMKDVLSK